MNITFLDASTLAPADLNLGPLRQLGTLTIFDTTAPDETVARCQKAEVVITNKVLITAEVFSSCPNLKLVLVAATGVNCVDLDAAKAKGVVVCNVAGYSTQCVAQHSFSLLLNLVTNAHRYGNEASLWPESPIFTRLDHPVIELSGRTLGIVGLGDIGSAVATIAQAFGMEVQALAREGSRNDILPGIPRVDRETFFTTSDVVSLHSPLTPETEHLINAETLGLMKPESILINTSRGPLIDEAALADALRSHSIAGAGLDVLSAEPPPADHPLLADDLLATGRLLITPHTAWTSNEARTRLLAGVTANLQAFIDGSPTNQVA
jgi:glycerate dehydrogenase